MFYTKIEIPSSDLKIDYSHQIMTLGSCFADNIGRKLQDVYFEVEINPFGALYNPISIINSLELLIENTCISEHQLFEYNSQWQSFSHSTQFSDNSIELCLNKINTRLKHASLFLAKTDFLLITLGTAWVYEEKESGRVVSNCHKLPASHFSRRRLSTEEITVEFSNLLRYIQLIFPKLQIIFSVSPIRHWKDGAHENNVSKSTLIVAVENLQQKFSNVHYFPAYEIQLDELRDYRYYAADMLHPSDVAIDYIWQRFSDTYFDVNTKKIKIELEKLSSDLHHRPLHPQSEEFVKFSTNLDRKIIEMKIKYPFLENKI